jgi:tetratricopeptide (TPR) repeat protein
MENFTSVAANAFAPSIPPLHADAQRAAMQGAVQALFEGAFALHQQGRLNEAARIYEQILKIDSRHADSLHLLGLIVNQAGKSDLAIQLIGQAINVRGNEASYYSNLGTIVQAQGQLDAAAACYRRALELNPRLAEVYLNLALVEQVRGHLDEAESGFRRATELKPDLAEAWSNLGNLLEQKKRREEAEPYFRKAIELKPGFAEAHYNLANLLEVREQWAEAAEHFEQAVQLKPGFSEAWANLGNLRQLQKRYEESERCHREAIRLRPDWADAHYNLGNVLAVTHRNEAAVLEFQEALRLNPMLTKARNNLGNILRTLERYEESVQEYKKIPQGDIEFGGAYNNMGLALLGLGHHQEAIAAIQQTLELVPGMAEAYCNLGAVYHAMNRLDAAELCYRQAQKISPELPKNRMNLGLIHLAKGQFETGWREYEWRWEGAPLLQRPFPQPQWQGEPLNGARILIHAEQGYGDTLQFLRYVPMVQQAGGRVVLEVQSRCVRLARELPGVEEVVAYGDALPQFDCHTPLLSLPRIFGTTLETIPAEVPYLRIPEEARRKMDAVAWPEGRLKVGLNWAGNPSFKNDRYRFRSLNFSDFERFLDLEDAQFYSLQMGVPAEQLRQDAGPIVDLAELTDDMADTAAQMERMDLVISADTSVAHLAGALGKTVWVPLPYTADWRWLLGRMDSPWYPTLRLFQQKKPGEWAPVAEAIREALGELTAAGKVARRLRN